MAKTKLIIWNRKEHRVPATRVIDNRVWTLRDYEYSKNGAQDRADFLRKHLDHRESGERQYHYARVIRWRPDARVWLIYVSRRPMTGAEKYDKKQSTKRSPERTRELREIKEFFFNTRDM